MADTLQHEWTELKGKIKEEWGRLTNDDLLEIAGQREQLLARIRQRYQIAQDEAERRVSDWERRVDLDRTTPR